MKNVRKLLLLTACAATSLAVAQSTPGEKWKITSSMQMAGMSMPGQSSEICKEPGQDAAPIRTDDNCQIYDMKRSGNEQSFKMRCTGKDAAEGSARFTYLGPDHYQGKMEMTADGQTMVINYEGKKLAGVCDGREANLQAKKMIAEGERQQKMAEQQTAEYCRKEAAAASGPAFLTMCKDPADKRTYCEAVRKPENFQRLSDQERKTTRYAANSNQPGARPLTESATACGFSAEKEREGLCQLADKNGNLDFIATECPTQAAGIAAAQCAGRRYTAIAERYRNFCSEFASAQGDDGSQDQQQAQDQPQTPAEKTKGLFNKGKKALGGLFSN